MAKYRKKPVVIEAHQWLATNSSWDAIYAWAGKNIECDSAQMTLVVATLEGVMHADPGDWIIKGVKGEFYPCKPDIFEATYEAVEAEEAPSPTPSTCSRCGAATEPVPPHDPPVPGPPDPPLDRHVDDKSYATWKGQHVGPRCKRPVL